MIDNNKGEMSENLNKKDDVHENFKHKASSSSFNVPKNTTGDGHPVLEKYPDAVRVVTKMSYEIIYNQWKAMMDKQIEDQNDPFYKDHGKTLEDLLWDARQYIRRIKGEIPFEETSSLFSRTKDTPPSKSPQGEMPSPLEMEHFSNESDEEVSIEASTSKASDSSDRFDEYDYTKITGETLKEAKKAFMQLKGNANKLRDGTSEYSREERIAAEKINEALFKYMKEERKLGNMFPTKVFISKNETRPPDNPKDAIKYAMRLMCEGSQNSDFTSDYFERYYKQFRAEMKRSTTKRPPKQVKLRFG